MSVDKLYKILDQLGYFRLDPEEAEDQIYVMEKIAEEAGQIVADWKDGLAFGFCSDEVFHSYYSGGWHEGYELCDWPGTREDLPFCEVGGWRLTNPEIRWEGDILALGDVPGYCGGASDGRKVCESPNKQ